MPPRVIPLVYVKGGSLVAPRREASWQPWATPESAPDVARSLFAHADALYVVDLDGLLGSGPNLAFYQALEQGRVFPWVDAGCQEPEDVMDVLFAGAEAITLRWSRMKTPKMVETCEISEVPLHLGLTVNGSGLEARTQPQDVLKLAQRTALSGVVLYEEPGADFEAAEAAALVWRANGLEVAWASRRDSPHRQRALDSERFTVVLNPTEESRGSQG